VGSHEPHVGPSFGNALNLRPYPNGKLLTKLCEVK
jgi:hypothetical protein